MERGRKEEVEDEASEEDGPAAPEAKRVTERRMGIERRNKRLR